MSRPRTYVIHAARNLTLRADLVSQDHIGRTPHTLRAEVTSRMMSWCARDIGPGSGASAVPTWETVTCPACLAAYRVAREGVAVAWPQRMTDPLQRYARNVVARELRAARGEERPRPGLVPKATSRRPVGAAARSMKARRAQEVGEAQGLDQAQGADEVQHQAHGDES